MDAELLQKEVTKRRSFAIISHPDAGKTTITEKLLLFGNAIQLAGTIKARKSGRHATSDWMTMEQERGISVTTSGILTRCTTFLKCRPYSEAMAARDSVPAKSRARM